MSTVSGRGGSQIFAAPGPSGMRGPLPGRQAHTAIIIDEWTIRGTVQVANHQHQLLNVAFEIGFLSLRPPYGDC